MLSIGSTEVLVIAFAALVVVGPDRLPKLMRDAGRLYGRLRRSADELRRAFVLEADRQDAEERFSKLQERRSEVLARRKAAVEAAGQGTVAQDRGLPGIEPPHESDEHDASQTPPADDSTVAEPSPALGGDDARGPQKGSS